MTSRGFLKTDRQWFPPTSLIQFDSRRQITHCGDLDGQKWLVETQAFAFSMKN